MYNESGRPKLEEKLFRASIISWSIIIGTGILWTGLLLTLKKAHG